MGWNWSRNFHCGTKADIEAVRRKVADAEKHG